MCRCQSYVAFGLFNIFSSLTFPVAFGDTVDIESANIFYWAGGMFASLLPLANPTLV